MKKLGLIGGTSWHSTIEYYKLINSYASEVMGLQGNPELIIHSINIELMRSQDMEKINSKYLEVARSLQNEGARAIVICANTPHMVYDFVQPKIDIPILHIADATGKEADKLGLKKLGLLGNRPTMTGEFIPKILQKNYAIQTIIPEPGFLDESHHFVSKELTRGIFSEEARKFYRSQIGLLKKNGADGIILGCTELPILLKEENLDIPLLATTDLHAEMAVDFIFS